MSYNLKTFWFKKSNIWQVIFILIILYSISTINVLLLTISLMPFLRTAFLKTHILVAFAQISFGLVAFLSIYHLSTMFRRRKRFSDRQEEEGR